MPRYDLLNPYNYDRDYRPLRPQSKHKDLNLFFFHLTLSYLPLEPAMVIRDFIRKIKNKFKKVIPEKKLDLKRVYISPPMIEGFFDWGSMRQVTRKDQIKEIEKREGKVFASDKELNQEADRNKKYREDKLVKELTEKITNDVLRSPHFRKY